MKKKMTALVLALMILCLSVFSTAFAQEAGQAASAETAAEKSGQAASAETAAPAAEEAQDSLTVPQEAYTGVWVSERITMYFEKQENSNYVVIYWPGSAAEIYQWVYRDVKYDAAAGQMVSGKNGEHTVLEYDENGRVAKAETRYTDGTATFKINAEGKLVWTDNMEPDDSNTFTFEKTEVTHEAPSVEEILEKYYRAVAGVDKTTMPAASAATVRFAVDAKTWNVKNQDLMDNLRKGWESLTEEERISFGKNYLEALGLASSCINDWESNRETFEKIDRAADMEMVVYDPLSKYAWANLFMWTYAIINPEQPEDLEAPGHVNVEKGDDSLHSSIQPVTDSPEWITSLPSAKEENVRQLFVVAGLGMDKTTATISMHQRDEDGKWKQILSTPGYVGKNGLVPDGERKEGCGQTPVGIYHFNKAFGIAADPGCVLPYTRVTPDLYWSGDNEKHYNELVDIKEIPELDVENSEHLIDYEYEYQYCLNISFNEDGTPGRGSAIFLHCLGTKKPYTGGCVAVPENIMQLIMQNVDPDCVVVIDTLENLGGSL